MEALIALGSNIEKEANLVQACAALADHPRIQLLAVSPVYATAAVGASGQPADQPAYANAALRVETSLSPGELRQALRAIEVQLGRVRSTDKFAPRPIDLDIAYYGASAIELDHKTIPDDDVLRYAHVAIPLAAVALEWVHPITGQTLAAIAHQWADQDMEKVSWTLTPAI